MISFFLKKKRTFERKMNNRIPPPFITFIFGLIIYFSRSFFPPNNTPYIENISVLFLILGLTIGILAISVFVKKKTTINPVNISKASSLVNTGVFKYTRNPMYLGMLFILLSISFKFNLYGGSIIVFIFYLFITRFQIIPEEKTMDQLFGQEYRDYKHSTRRWL